MMGRRRGVVVDMAAARRRIENRRLVELVVGLDAECARQVELAGYTSMAELLDDIEPVVEPEG